MKNIWEEKNSTEHRKNSEIKNVIETDDIMSGIDSTYCESECSDITKKYQRICPKCGKLLNYTHRDSYRQSIKNNAVCKSCSLTKHSGPFIKKCGLCGIDIRYDRYKSYIWSVKNNGFCKKCGGKKTIQTRLDRNNLYNNRNQSVESKTKMSAMHSGKNNPFYGKKHTDKTKITLRKNTIKNIEQIKGGRMFPLYNKKSCEYFTELEKQNNWDGYYATKTGEFYIDKLGYWVDYYEPTLNIVIEWDEKSHFNFDGSLKDRDISRMGDIKKYLGCEFYRIDEKTKVLTKY